MEVKTIKVGELQTNCYLLISEKELVIIDPGAEANRILKEIEKTGGRAKYIINTHYHFDHVLANREVREKTGAEILTDLKEGDEIKTGNVVLRVVYTPGHTEESICLLGDNFVFTGDTLFETGHGRTDLAGGSQEKIEESLQKLSELLKPGMTVYPGHGSVFQAK